MNHSKKWKNHSEIIRSGMDHRKFHFKDSVSQFMGKPAGSVMPQKWNMYFCVEGHFSRFLTFNTFLRRLFPSTPSEKMAQAHCLLLSLDRETPEVQPQGALGGWLDSSRGAGKHWKPWGGKSAQPLHCGTSSVLSRGGFWIWSGSCYWYVNLT